MHYTAIIQLLLWKMFIISLLLQTLNEVSQSNIIFVFFLYIWSFKVNSIFIIIRICLFLSKLNINWFLLSLFSSKLLLYLIKVLATGRAVAKIFLMKYIFTLCVFTALLPQDQTTLMWIQSSKLIYELFLIYS